MVSISMVLMREMWPVPMSLITTPSVRVHSTPMVVVWRTIRSNKLTVPTFTVRHSNTIITILITTVSHVIPWTVHVVTMTVTIIPSAVVMAMSVTMLRW